MNYFGQQNYWRHSRKECLCQIRRKLVNTFWKMSVKTYFRVQDWCSFHGPGFRPSSYGKLNISILHSKFASKDNSTVKTSEFVKIRVLKSPSIFVSSLTTQLSHKYCAFSSGDTSLGKFSLVIYSFTNNCVAYNVTIRQSPRLHKEIH